MLVVRGSLRIRQFPFVSSWMSIFLVFFTVFQTISTSSALCRIFASLDKYLSSSISCVANFKLNFLILFLIQWAQTAFVHYIAVLIIMTSKHFWLLQSTWHQIWVTYLWCIANCSHWNHCIWSQEVWEHKCLVLKNGMLFYRFMVEWVFLLHKMTIKGLITVIS